MLLRERPLVAAGLPAPTALPSLSDALARRASVFGPFDGDDAPAIPPMGLSRRSGLLGAVAALGTAALARSAARAISVVISPPHADARLVAWCDELPGIDAALSDLFARAPDVEADSRIDALSVRWCAVTDGIRHTPARGPAGLAAKARAVQHLAAQGDMEVATPIAASLAADVLRLGRAA